jgi:hypothetical protein
MKKAIKTNITEACAAKGLTEYQAALMCEIYDTQMKAAAQRKPARIVATVASVSASGMSRRVKFGYINKLGEFIDVTRLFADLYGSKMRSSYSGFTVRGCGMDMLFAVLDNIFYTITPHSEWSKYSDFCQYKRF